MCSRDILNVCSKTVFLGARRTQTLHHLEVETACLGGSFCVDLSRQDWLPTLYGRAGGDVQKLLNIDGYDMWPSLSKGEKSPRKELVHNIDPVTWASALRYEQWKLLVNESEKCVLVIS